jgi:hypothetical protein
MDTDAYLVLRVTGVETLAPVRDPTAVCRWWGRPTAPSSGSPSGHSEKTIRLSATACRASGPSAGERGWLWSC